MPNKHQNVARKLIGLEVRLGLLVEAIKDHPDFFDIETDAEENFEEFVREVRSIVELMNQPIPDDSDSEMLSYMDIEPIFNPVTMEAAEEDEKN
jgi:hypothetical protein